MDKNQLIDLPVINGFRMRGENMTRLEVFSDAAFAFAITMLVVSVGNIPKSHNELILALKATPAFAISFALLAWYWVSHRKWSRQYGLEDGVATILTLAMIFIIMVYVYPLKLMSSTFCHFISGGWFPSEYQVTSQTQIADLFIIFGIGSFALSGVIALLYHHALSKTDNLCLNTIEKIVTSRQRAIWASHAFLSFFQHYSQPVFQLR